MEPIKLSDCQRHHVLCHRELLDRLVYERNQLSKQVAQMTADIEERRQALMYHLLTEYELKSGSYHLREKDGNFWLEGTPDTDTKDAEGEGEPASEGEATEAAE